MQGGAGQSLLPWGRPAIQLREGFVPRRESGPGAASTSWCGNWGEPASWLKNVVIQGQPAPQPAPMAALCSSLQQPSIPWVSTHRGPLWVPSPPGQSPLPIISAEQRWLCLNEPHYCRAVESCEVLTGRDLRADGAMSLGGYSL